MALVLASGAIVAAANAAVADASDPAELSSTGRVSFTDLGWEEDRGISPGSPASVRFRLPEGARQGTPIWYGITLKFEWIGAPGSVGDYGFLNGRWNEHAIYQFKVKRTTDLYGGFQWPMVDAINGSSVGYELGDTFSGSSSNVAQLEAVQGGWNEVGLSLRLRDAGNDDIRVVISRESEIVATSWRPTFIDGHAETRVRDNVVDLDIEGINRGWAAPSLSAAALVWSGPHRDVFKWDVGPIGPLGTFDLEERIVLEEGRVPHRIDVQLDWETGRETYTVWAGREESLGARLLGRPAFRSTIGVMLAIAVLWVCVPLVFSALRSGRK